MTAAATRPPTFELQLSRRVHDRLVLDLSLRLGPSRGIVFGPSGAGKSTLLRLIAGLERPDAGFVRLAGEPLYDSAEGIDRPLRKRRIGMVFQDDLLFPHLGVARNIQFGLKGWPKAEADARLVEIADLCGVLGLLDRPAETLSGGERQRVGLARALAPRPRLLLCDEPVSALDIPARTALIDRLREVQQAEGIPMLYVTHSPSEAVALGETLFLLEAGRIKAEGPPIDVLAGTSPVVSDALGGVRNSFPAIVIDHPERENATHLQLDGGPVLVVARVPASPGARVTVDVLADEILLARGPVEGLSARNILPATVERVLTHGSEAEVLVRTGALTWVVSVVTPALASLEIQAGAPIWLILKARSCRVAPRVP